MFVVRGFVEPTERDVSLKIHPNLSTWQTIELSYQCAKYAVDNNIEGDFVECGIAAGNNFGAMCLAGRHGWGFDSFEGIPWATKEDRYQPGIGEVEKSKIGLLESSGISSYPIEAAQDNLKRWGIENYTLVKGWFQDTVKDWHGGKIAVLRLDGDMYESTKVCLEHLYPFLSRKGILIIDDWNLKGCRTAFNEYFKKKPELLLNNGRTYWLKE